MMGRAAPAAERFAAKTRVDASGCWLWTAGMNNGYGRFNDGTRLVYAHRWSYEHHVGAIPEGLQIDHLCRNRACVNPAHLEPVTQLVNLHRGDTITARNAAKTSCVRGHPFTVTNTYVTPQGYRQCRTCRRLRDTQKIGEAA